MLKNLKIGVKLFMGFGVVLAIFALVGVIGLVKMDAVKRFGLVMRDQLVPLNTVGSLVDRHSSTAKYELLRYRWVQDPKMYEMVTDASTKGILELNKAGELLANPTEPEQITMKKSVDDMKILFGEFVKAGEGIKEHTAEMGTHARDVEAMFAGALEHLTSINQTYVRDIKAGRVADVSGEVRDFKYFANRLQDVFSVTTDMGLLYAIYNRAVTGDNIDLYKAEVIPMADKTLAALDAIKNSSDAARNKEIVELKEHGSEMIENIRGYLDAWQLLKTSEAELAKSEGELAHLAIKMVDDTSITIEDGAQETVFSLNTSMLILIGGVVLGVILGGAVAFAITRNITKPLQRVVELAGRASEGDLTVVKADYQYDGKDEIGVLIDALDQMVASTESAMQQIIKVSENVSAESQNLAALAEESNASMEEIRASVDMVNRLSQENSAALEESNAGIEEMAAGATTVAHSSSDGAENVAVTNDETNRAVTAVNEIIQEMDSIGKKSAENEQQIRKLATSVEQISNFVSVITGIADQTNLLALNAAIEAARAGEAGRGFAVVAEEVRKLAEESGNAAQSVGDQIGGLQDNAQSAITGMNVTAEIIRDTLQKTDIAQKGLAGTMSRMKEVSEGIQSIAAVAQEQAASSKEMAESIDKVTQATIEVTDRVTGVRTASQDASKATEGVAMAAQTLSSHAENLQKQLSRFKVRQTPAALSSGR